MIMTTTTIQKTISDDKLFKILNRISSKQKQKTFDNDEKTFKKMVKIFDSCNDGYKK